MFSWLFVITSKPKEMIACTLKKIDHRGFHPTYLCQKLRRVTELFNEPLAVRQPLKAQSLSLNHAAVSKRASFETSGQPHDTSMQVP